MDPEFDFRLSSKKAVTYSRFPLRYIAQLLVPVALVSLAFTSMAHCGTRSQPNLKPPLLIKHPARSGNKLDHYQWLYGQTPLSLPANPSRFVIPAPQGFDERFIVTAPSEIDDRMIVSPHRTEPFVNPNLIPYRVAPAVPAR